MSRDPSTLIFCTTCRRKLIKKTVSYSAHHKYNATTGERYPDTFYNYLQCPKWRNGWDDHDRYMLIPTGLGKVIAEKT